MQSIMLKYIKQYKFHNLAVTAIMIVQNLILLATTFLTMQSARFVMDGSLNLVLACMLGLVLSFIIFQITCVLKDILAARTIKYMNQAMRDDLNQKLMNRNAEEFLHTDTGEYLSWYINDVKEAEEQGYQNIYEAIDCIIKLAIGSIVLAVIKIELLICTLIVTGTVFFLSRFLERGVEQSSGKVSRMLEEFTETIKEQIAGYKVLKYFGHGQSFVENIDVNTRNLENERFAYAKVKQKAALKLSTLNSLGNFVNMLVLFGMCTLKIIPAEIFFGGGNLTTQVKDSLIGLSQCKILLTGAKPYFNKLQNINKSNSQIDKELLPEIHESIQLNGLDFGYHDSLLFQNVHLDFKIGGKYAIIGKSGCGKSTLLKLISGQILGYQGDILFDGKDARQFAPDSFYLRMAYIEQNVFLFHTSIRNNITLGKNFSNQEIDEALRKSALIQDMDHFPDGLDSDVGENGKNLSGGQKQRIAIARALIYKRSILLVDEGTSALDQENASIIEDSLLECKDLTLLLVSHHLDPEKLNAYTKVYNISETGGNRVCGNI